MLKHKKQPTAQELWSARKQREEEERDANLPPGLINHGNTCFMNSTLQGLIATPLLHSLVNFEEPSTPGTSVLARRSPQLTNGHGRGGTYEREWEQGMPLGDVFVATMQRAWGIQQAHRRENMSPKDLLTTIGHKYDQYLDFRQQDAHEFLRHMLDAMRMEELDIIKKRQPPPPKPKRRRKKTVHKSDGPNGASEPDATPEDVPPEIPEEERLQSFVDMLFGGRLASILVCDACKKVSVTHEDFNDLSLSIKPEDYVKERKRDRLKLLAKKLRLRKDSEASIPTSSHRASSVPASPIRHSMEPLPHEEEAPVNVDHRRRSFDHVGTPGDEKDSSDDAKEPPVGGERDGKETPPDSSAVEAREASPERPEGKVPHVEFLETVHDKEKKPKDDAWGKLGRRISMSMSMGMSKKDKRLSRSKEAGWRGRNSKDKDSLTDTSRAPSEERPPLTKRHSHSGHVESVSDFSEASELPKGRGATPSPHPSPLGSPALNFAGSFPNARKASVLSIGEKRSKSPRPPKPSRQETAFLRQLLADVHPSSPGPLSAIQHALGGGSQTNLGLSSPPLTSQTLLAKLGHLPGIEECLRLFTAVEVLDGENMVGCHRCWKIANGTYRPREQEEEQENDSDEGSQGSPIVIHDVPAEMDGRDSSPEGPDHFSPVSTTIISESAASSSVFLHDTASVSSAPTTVQSTPTEPKPSLVTDDVPRPATPPAKTPDAPVPSYGGLPIPSISTTGPDTPTSVPFIPRPADDSETPASASNGSLVPPRVQKRRASRRRGSDDSGSSLDNDGYDSTDVSGDDSAYSEASSVASLSPSVSPRTSTDKLPSHQAHADASAKPRSDGKIPKSQQVILRRAYKRYLIATPPPILVVHLKRFQQISKSNPYAMAFSGGFKKLEDFVAFPEYLDLAPFLAPKKEDFGLSKKGEKKSDAAPPSSKHQQCKYRLYAVVVHIGNMLGGHYVAYTALPPSSSSSLSAVKSEPTATTEAHPRPQTESTAGPSSSQRPRQWAYISDTVVRLTTLEEVLKAKAYICMYERL